MQPNTPESRMIQLIGSALKGMEWVPVLGISQPWI